MHLRLLGPNKEVLPYQKRLLQHIGHLGDLRPDLSDSRGHPPDSVNNELLERQNRRVLHRHIVNQVMRHYQ